jgi:viroplasmin and RNaseH domain-containing protein
MNNRYRSTFKLFDTEEQAKVFCDNENTNNYIRKNHPAHYTSWSSANGQENKFVAWYVIK